MLRSSSESRAGSPFERSRSIVDSGSSARRAAPTWAAQTYAASRSRTEARIAIERSCGSTMLSSRLNLTSCSIFPASCGLCSSMLNGPRIWPKTPTTSSTTLWNSAGTSALPVIGGTRGMFLSLLLFGLQAGVGLAPLVAVDDVLQGPTAQLAEIAHRPADRQDRVGMGAGWQAENRVDLLAVAGMPRRQGRAEPERPGRQAHVLHRPIDRRAGGAARVLAVFEAGDDPHRRLVVMVGQVFDRGVLALVARRVGARRRCAAGI